MALTKPLAELLMGMETLEVLNFQNLIITGISYNSNSVKPGNLFVAINGHRQDGHDFIYQAVNNGAVAILGAKKFTNLSIPYIRVSDTRKILALLANIFYDHPANKLINIGVTGTNGKTTTSILINHILECAGYRTGLIGTVENKINGRSFPAHLTTPEAPDIHYFLRKMVEEDCHFSCMEVSSQGIALNRVDKINFDYGVVTNIDLDHTDCHPTFNNYLNTKIKFMEMTDKNSYILLNADDPYFNEFKKARRNNYLSYGIDKQADIKVVERSQSSKGSFFVIKINKTILTRDGQSITPLIIPIFINLLGKHNIYNAMVAVVIALLNDIPIKTIIKSLANFNNVPRRCQIIYNDDFTIIDDTALNPHSYEAIFHTVRSLNTRKISVVNAIRGNRGPEINIANAKKIAYWVSKLNISNLIITNSLHNTGPNNQVSPLEEKAFRAVFDEKGLKYRHFYDLRNAITAGISGVQKGELLLLLGAQGMDDGACISLELIQTNQYAMAKYC